MRKNLFVCALLIAGLMSCNVDFKLFFKRLKEKEEINKVSVEKVVREDSIIKDEKDELISALIYVLIMLGKW